MATRLRRPRPSSPTDPVWQGVRLRRLRIGPDPDAPRRDVQIPALWEDEAAAALAALTPAGEAAELPQAVDRWALPLAQAVTASEAAGAAAGSAASLARSLAASLAASLADAILCRRFAPDAACWAGAGRPRTIVLRLSAFCGGEAAGDDSGCGFALGPYQDTVALIGRLLPPDGQLRLTDLDAALAGIGLAYDSAEARAAAAALAAIATAGLLAVGAQELAPAPLPRDASPFAEAFHDAPPPLAAAALRAWQTAPRAQAAAPRRAVPLVALAARDAAKRLRTTTGHGDDATAAVEALLGVEARGIAPVFAPVAADGSLRRSTLARLAAARLTPEQALARLLSGEPAPLVADPGGRTRAHLAMHAAIAPFLDLPPPLPAQQFELDLPTGSGTAPERPRRRELPARHRGFTQKVTIGGHRLFLRTAEYDDGSLGEIEILPTREGTALRGAIEAFGQAVSIALQYGVPLDAFVDGFAHARFGARSDSGAGTVEGDAQIAQASSVPDYVFRTLAAHYLGRSIGDPDVIEGGAPGIGAGETPLLPMTLPIEPPAGPPPGRRRGRASLRLVS